MQTTHPASAAKIAIVASKLKSYAVVECVPQRMEKESEFCNERRYSEGIDSLSYLSAQYIGIQTCRPR
jgi:hypothetical protein